MRPLPDTFRHDSFDFRLLKRAGAVALLVKSKPGGTPTYEVVRLVRVPDREMFGREIPAHEAMPASELWGERGWSYPDPNRAKAKFAALTDTVRPAAGMPRTTHDEGQNSRPPEPQAVVTP
jgi:hypothetical protein